MRWACAGLVAVLALAFGASIGGGPGADGPLFALEQVRKGASIFAQNCAACHGVRMADSQSAVVDLRKFPADQKGRFVTSVSKGKNQMPPWGDVLAPGDIDALWAYVMMGERH
jgi:mono/diheme cytochrome c family protein